MPVYEFECGKCGERFDCFVHSLERIEGVSCPKCGSKKVEKLISGFSCGGGSCGSGGSTPGGSSSGFG